MAKSKAKANAAELGGRNKNGNQTLKALEKRKRKLEHKQVHLQKQLKHQERMKQQQQAKQQKQAKQQQEAKQRDSNGISKQYNNFDKDASLARTKKHQADAMRMAAEATSAPSSRAKNHVADAVHRATAAMRADAVLVDSVPDDMDMDDHATGESLESLRARDISKSGAQEPIAYGTSPPQTAGRLGVLTSATGQYDTINTFGGPIKLDQGMKMAIGHIIVDGPTHMFYEDHVRTVLTACGSLTKDGLPLQRVMELIHAQARELGMGEAGVTAETHLHKAWCVEQARQLAEEVDDEALGDVIAALKGKTALRRQQTPGLSAIYESFRSGTPQPDALGAEQGFIQPRQPASATQSRQQGRMSRPPVPTITVSAPTQGFQSGPSAITTKSAQPSGSTFGRLSSMLAFGGPSQAPASQGKYQPGFWPFGNASLPQPQTGGLASSSDDRLAAMAHNYLRSTEASAGAASPSVKTEDPIILAPFAGAVQHQPLGVLQEAPAHSDVAVKVELEGGGSDRENVGGPGEPGFFHPAASGIANQARHFVHNTDERPSVPRASSIVPEQPVHILPVVPQESKAVTPTASCVMVMDSHMFNSVDMWKACQTLFAKYGFRGMERIDRHHMVYLQDRQAAVQATNDTFTVDGKTCRITLVGQRYMSMHQVFAAHTLVEPADSETLIPALAHVLGVPFCLEESREKYTVVVTLDQGVRPASFRVKVPGDGRPQTIKFQATSMINCKHCGARHTVLAKCTALTVAPAPVQGMLLYLDAPPAV